MNLLNVLKFRQSTRVEHPVAKGFGAPPHWRGRSAIRESQTSEDAESTRNDTNVAKMNRQENRQ